MLVSLWAAGTGRPPAGYMSMDAGPAVRTGRRRRTGPARLNIVHAQAVKLAVIGASRITSTWSADSLAKARQRTTSAMLS